MKQRRKKRAECAAQPKSKLRAARNARVNAQTRKILGKHYASKYRVA